MPKHVWDSVPVYFNISGVCAVGNKTPRTRTVELKEIRVDKQLKCGLVSS